MITFEDFIHKYDSKNKATSDIRIQSVCKDVDIYLKDGPFKADIGIVNLHQTKGTHWVAYINQNYSDSYGCSPPQKLSRFITKRKGYCFYSKYIIRSVDSYCAAYCSYIIYLTKVIGIDFKSAVLILY